MAKPGLSVEVDGLTQTLKAFQALDMDLRRQANGRLRQAAGDCARRLIGLLVQAAHSCGVPVAPLVARSLRVSNDRLPAVTVGGKRRVGRNGAPAERLVWGSEQGPKSEPNRWGVPASSGYWLAPTVARFRGDEAVAVYKRAVYDLMREHRLV